MTGDESRFASGPYAGQKLGDVWPAMSAEWRGTSLRDARAFPLLIKFIFAEDKLSVQVHPDDEYASQHEQAAGGRGKTEMWYAVRARPGAEVLVGLKPSVTRESFERAIADGTAENCLERIPLKDRRRHFCSSSHCAHHRPRTGALRNSAELRSHLSCLRLQPPRRARPLPRIAHRKGSRCDSVWRTTRRENPGAANPSRPGCRDSPRRLRILHHGAMGIWRTHRVRHLTEHFDVLIFLEGTGTIHWGDNHEAYGPAQVWLIPAALGKYELHPNAPNAARHRPRPFSAIPTSPRGRRGTACCARRPYLATCPPSASCKRARRLNYAVIPSEVSRVFAFRAVFARAKRSRGISLRCNARRRAHLRGDRPN